MSSPSHHNSMQLNCHDPIAMHSKLTELDGSVMAERGEPFARCAGNSMNFVAMNRAHDIVNGSGREKMPAKNTRLSKTYKRGEKARYTQGFSVECPQRSTEMPISQRS